MASVSPLIAEIGPAYAVVKCKIVTGTGQMIVDGTVLIRDGLIKAVGPRSKIDIPADADVIDGEGKVVYPGLIDAWTSIYLEIPQQAPLGFMQAFAGIPKNQQDDGRHVDYQAFRKLNPQKKDRDMYHKLGITTALSAPEIGYLSGQSVLLNLNQGEVRDMVLLNPVALHIQFNAARGVYPTSVMGTMAALRQAFLDVEYSQTYTRLYQRSGKAIKRPAYDPFLEDLAPYSVGGEPVIFSCNNQEDIKRALRLHDEFKLNTILAGAEEAWRVADMIKAAGVPLIVSVTFKPPYSSIHFSMDKEKKKKAEEEVYSLNPAQLAEHGIPFALTTHGLPKATDFFKQIRLAIKVGLPEDIALEALTIQPARILGIDDVLGSLAPGKIANLILADGGLFAENTRIEKVFVDGRLFHIKHQPTPEKAAQSLSGSWKGTAEGELIKGDIVLTIANENDVFTGILTGPFGKGSLEKIKLEDAQVSFKVRIEGKEEIWSFSGTLRGNTLEGILEGSGESAMLKLEKQPEGEVK